MTNRRTYRGKRPARLPSGLLHVAFGVLLILSTSAAHALADPVPKAFAGKFRGVLTSSGGEVEGEFTVVTQTTRNGFTMSWPMNDGVEFAATNRKDQFQAPVDGRAIEGAKVRWARLAGGNLLVYSLRIDEHGGYNIDTFVYSPVADGLELTVRRLRAGSQPLESKGKLDRYDR